MGYTCGVCQDHVDGDLVALKEHTDQHIIDIIKVQKPHWVEADGVCPKCLNYLREQIKGG